jgi:hypothetical protein
LSIALSIQLAAEFSCSHPIPLVPPVTTAVVPCGSVHPGPVLARTEQKEAQVTRRRRSAAVIVIVRYLISDAVIVARFSGEVPGMLGMLGCFVRAQRWSYLRTRYSGVLARLLVKLVKLS